MPTEINRDNRSPIQESVLLITIGSRSTIDAVVAGGAVAEPTADEGSARPRARDRGSLRWRIDQPAAIDAGKQSGGIIVFLTPQ
jgi:hypothetical protein